MSLKSEIAPVEEKPKRRCLPIAITIALGVVVALTGCGYFTAGEWDDDPKNWGRAFRSEKPAEVVVVHSRFVQTPHWSYEFAYFFEIEPDAALREQLFAENELTRLTGDEAIAAKSDTFVDSPTGSRRAAPRRTTSSPPRTDPSATSVC